MTMRMSALGQKMLRLTGVREILRDIEQTTSSSDSEGWINLSAGNPLIIPQLTTLWYDIAAGLNKEVFGEIIGRYGSSHGYSPFLDALIEHMNAEYDWNITEKNIVVTPGSQSLFFILTNIFGGVDCADRQHKIFLPMTPEYTGYDGAALSDNVLCTATPLIEKFDEHEFRYAIDFSNLNIGDDIAALLLSRPGNPTGCVVRDEEMGRLSKISEKLDIPLIIDSAYGQPFPGLNYVPMKPFFDQQVVYCMSLSKAGIPGERIGVAIANESVIEAVTAFLTNSNIHSSRFGQVLAATAIKDGLLKTICSEIVRPLYKDKSIYLKNLLMTHLPDINWRLHKIEGGMFGWLWFEDFPVDDKVLYAYLKQEKVFVVPGSYFFVGHDSEWRHKNECIRISLTATNEDLAQGVESLGKVVRRIYQMD